MPEPSDRYQPLPGLTELPGFLLRKLPPRRRRVVLAVLAAVAVAAIAGAVIALPAIHAHQRAQAEAQQRRDAAAWRRRRALYARQAHPRHGQGPAARGLTGAQAIAARRRLVGSLEASVLADARVRAPKDLAPHGYRSTSCEAYPKQLGGVPPQDDPHLTSAVMECVAATSVVHRNGFTTGSQIGQPFLARVDFRRGAYAWCEIVQQPGEMSIQRERVLRVPPACGGDG